jgi:hypothetical protein
MYVNEVHHVHVRIRMCAHAHAHDTFVCTHTHEHVSNALGLMPNRRQVRRGTCRHAHNNRARTHARAHTLPRAYTYSPTPTYFARIRMRARVHTHTHTHTHAHRTLRIRQMAMRLRADLNIPRHVHSAAITPTFPDMSTQQPSRQHSQTCPLSSHHAGIINGHKRTHTYAHSC